MKYSKTIQKSSNFTHSPYYIQQSKNNIDLDNLSHDPIQSINIKIPSTASLEQKLKLFKSNTMPSNSTPIINSENKLTQLERDREYLILKNIELENEINKLDGMLTNTFTKLSNATDREKRKEQQKPKIDNKRVTIIEENQKLRKKVKDLEMIINNLLSRAENNKAKSDIRLEVKLWKERTRQLSENYLKTLHDIHTELNKDKMAFKLSIKKIQSKFVKDVKDLENFYNPQMIKNEKKIQLLLKEQNDLRKKEEKLKEVFMYNFK